MFFDHLNYKAGFDLILEVLILSSSPSPQKQKQNNKKVEYKVFGTSERGNINVTDFEICFTEIRTRN